MRKYENSILRRPGQTSGCSLVELESHLNNPKIHRTSRKKKYISAIFDVSEGNKNKQQDNFKMNSRNPPSPTKNFLNSVFATWNKCLFINKDCISDGLFVQ